MDGGVVLRYAAPGGALVWFLDWTFNILNDVEAPRPLTVRFPRRRIAVKRPGT